MPKPKPLKPGDRIGVISPAGPVDPERLERGCNVLRSMGYEVELGSAALDRDRYFAGTPERRACNLNSFLRRDDIQCILSSRGGYGANYILDRVQYGLMRQNPKWFGGYSDITVLLSQFHDRADVPVLHAPLVAGDFDRDNGVDLDSWNAVVSGNLHTYEVPTTIREGQAEGKLYGGCLSLMVSMLSTSYEPCTEDTILFLEDLNEPPYKIDRMLRQLELAGKLRNVNGIVFGTMCNCGDRIAEHIAHMLQWFDKPIAFGLPSGHAVLPHQTLAFGLRVRLTAKTSGASLTMLESATD
ncbi:MAG TPA: LD-carboxypeptidase [Terriglobales bacterium]|jgi:muramoyltetrapeptide carboxypeptidase